MLEASTRSKTTTQYIHCDAAPTIPCPCATLPIKSPPGTELRALDARLVASDAGPGTFPLARSETAEEPTPPTALAAAEARGPPAASEQDLRQIQINFQHEDLIPLFLQGFLDNHK